MYFLYQTGSSSDADLERQMHTDAAQSVLEMGYTPHVIRSALRALRDGNDGRTLNATILMEKIFELEDEASANDENNQPVQGTPPNQSNAIAQAPVTINNNTQSQRVLIDTGSASSNSARTQSAPVGDKSSQASLTTNASSEATRPQNKKSQLLEQKKLKQENEQMKQQSLCTKCKQNDVCIVFLPCGHLVTCETCAPKIRYCSVESCGKYIKGTVRAYLAKTVIKSVVMFGRNELRNITPIPQRIQSYKDFGRHLRQVLFLLKILSGHKSSLGIGIYDGMISNNEFT
ncbi:baculoviral IAP repeat-containing protein 3-like [Ruditapes philippinarum]|uniref:baculoviral IAP repeat-containing protein 3-like n=1 Tax=Ruditapes philippinarum TaxID=129788 RepID=UPI00295B58F9|nr:baculoviral IAP repeat-containing protein 3-like [Ruditapes philippinarum]